MTDTGKAFKIGRIKSEADLHPVRQAFTDLALRLREKTGLLLEYALSFTVTRRNIEESQQLLRARERDESQGQVPRPPKEDPQFSHPGVNQGLRRNVPTGGSTGALQQGKPRP